jgi:2,4-dienoyl-CoA reductase-like NADH-dependent reductase (Old Yellow Enzyme family)
LLMHPLLFTPDSIGPLKIRNRTIRAAAFEGMCPGNHPSQMLLDYHRSVAAGGIGMTTLAYASVAPGGLSFSHQLHLRREGIPELRRISDAIHREGAAAAIQIGHCGNMSKKSIAGIQPVTASGGLNIYSPTWARSMNRDDISRLAADFGEAVIVARESGFDAVEVHAGHGYLISQFLSPYTNHRRDDFGGSLVNRMRLMRLVMQEVLHAAGGNTAVVVKMNMRDGFTGGMEMEETLEVARTLEKDGAHALVLSGGFVSKAPMYVMRGAMPVRTLTHYMPASLTKLGICIAGKLMIRPVPFTELYFLEDALNFRKAIKIPLIYVGGIVSGENMGRVLDSGFEFVSMARALLHNPGFVHRLKTEPTVRSGCEHANYCIARMYTKEMACYQHMKELPPALLKELNRNAENV